LYYENQYTDKTQPFKSLGCKVALNKKTEKIYAQNKCCYFYSSNNIEKKCIMFFFLEILNSVFNILMISKVSLMTGVMILKIQPLPSEE